MGRSLLYLSYNKTCNDCCELLELESVTTHLTPTSSVPRPQVDSYLENWRRLLRGSVIQARQVLQKIIKGRILMIPLPNGVGYEFRAHTRFDKLFHGMAVPLPQRLEGTTGNAGWEHLTSEDTLDAEKKLLRQSDGAEKDPYDLVSPIGHGTYSALRVRGRVA